MQGWLWLFFNSTNFGRLKENIITVITVLQKFEICILLNILEFAGNTKLNQMNCRNIFLRVLNIRNAYKKNFHLTLQASIATLVSLHKNPLYSLLQLLQFWNFGTKYQLKSPSVIQTCPCIKPYITQPINFCDLLQKELFMLNCIHIF